jgi:cystathionine beta-synthase
MVCDNLSGTIGNTPLVRLNKITSGLTGKYYAKVEAFNPGQSAKDRIASYMVEQAEKKGLLKPGGTIVEATSGNTGFSIAMLSAIKGYKCILTLTSKASTEKISLLKSLGAEVVICPVDVKPEDPRSYYARAEQIAKETPNAFYLGQNFNLDNAAAHYHSTGPEIWRQTEGKITHYVCCAGTGGTLSGVAKYLKEQNPNIRIIGIDAYGSVLKKFWETGIYDPNEIKPYKVEGLGKNIIPSNIDFSLIDDFIKVNDRDSALRARELAAKEGLLMGYSSGSAMQGIFQIQHELDENSVVVALFSDHGSRYLGKIYNDGWMTEQGYLSGNESETKVPSINDWEDHEHYYSYESVKKRYRTYYRIYRLMYRKYISQTRKSLGL